MMPVSNSTLNIVLPDSYQCPSIRGTDYRLPLPSAPPPFTYSWDKRESPSGNRKDTLPLCRDSWRGRCWLQSDYNYPGNEALFVLSTISETPMATGHLSRITSSWLFLPPALFPFILCCLSVAYLPSARPCAKC